MDEGAQYLVIHNEEVIATGIIEIFFAVKLGTTLVEFLTDDTLEFIDYKAIWFAPSGYTKGSMKISAWENTPSGFRYGGTFIGHETISRQS